MCHVLYREREGKKDEKTGALRCEVEVSGESGLSTLLLPQVKAII